MVPTGLTNEAGRLSSVPAASCPQYILYSSAAAATSPSPYHLTAFRLASTGLESERSAAATDPSSPSPALSSSLTATRVWFHIAMCTCNHAPTAVEVLVDVQFCTRAAVHGS